MAFVAGNGTSFGSITHGKIWYTQIPQSGSLPQPVLVSSADGSDSEVRKRTEPEVHQADGGPDILWTEANDHDDPQFEGCDPDTPVLAVNDDIGLDPPTY